MLVYSGLYCSIFVYVGLYWSILVYIVLYWSMLVYVGLYWSILVYIGLYWSIFFYIGLYWSILFYIGLCWSMLVYIGLYWSPRQVHVIPVRYIFEKSTNIIFHENPSSGSPVAPCSMKYCRNQRFVFRLLNEYAVFSTAYSFTRW